MRSSFVPFLLMTVATLAGYRSCLAQKPAYDVTIIADGKSLDLSQGIPVSTRTIELIGQLTPESQQQYSQFKPIIVINRAILNLVRDSRRVSYTDWPGNKSVARLFKEAKEGDQFVVQFEDVTLQTKQGLAQKVDKLKIVQVTIKK